MERKVVELEPANVEMSFSQNPLYQEVSYSHNPLHIDVDDDLEMTESRPGNDENV